MICLNIILITAIIVYLIDTNDFIEHIKHMIWRIAFKKKPYNDFDLKPLSCSYCMSFWAGLLYLLITGNFTLPYCAFVCLCSFMTPVILLGLHFIQDLLTRIIEALYTYFKL